MTPSFAGSRKLHGELYPSRTFEGPMGPENLEHVQYVYERIKKRGEDKCHTCPLPPGDWDVGGYSPLPQDSYVSFPVAG